MRHILLVMLALASQCANANAWGDEGQKMICRMAFPPRAAGYPSCGTQADTIRYGLCATLSLGNPGETARRDIATQAFRFVAALYDT